MYDMIWFVIVTLCCMPWIAMIFMSNRTRVQPPLPPGPLGLPIVGSMPFLGSNIQSYFGYLTMTYGPLVSLRIGQRIGILVASASMAKEALKDLDVTFANHVVSAASWEASYGGLSIAWTPYSDKWRLIRKFCAREMLGPAAMNATYKLRKTEIHQTMLYLHTQAGSPVNIQDQMYSMAMSMVTNMIWGGTVKGNAERAKLNQDFLVVVEELTMLMEAPNVSDVFPVLARFDLQGIVKKVRGCMKRLDDIFNVAVIHHHRSKKMDKFEGCQKDFLQLIMELDDSPSKNTSFTMDQLKALIMDVVSGQRTIINTIEFAMAEIVNKSEVMTRVQQELDTIPKASNASLEESHVHQLPYLQAIMKETLRLHPVQPLLLPRCPSQSCVVGGYTIPKDSTIFVNVPAIHRDPSLWEDPLEFKPERFLDGRRRDFTGNDLTYFPFGSGRRNCVGIPMAEKTVLYSLASLLHYFNWKLPDGVEKVDLAEKFGTTMQKLTPLFLIPSPRTSNVEELISSLVD